MASLAELTGEALWEVARALGVRTHEAAARLAARAPGVPAEAVHLVAGALALAAQADTPAEAGALLEAAATVRPGLRPGRGAFRAFNRGVECVMRCAARADDGGGGGSGGALDECLRGLQSLHV